MSSRDECAVSGAAVSAGATGVRSLTGVRDGLRRWRYSTRRDGVVSSGAGLRDAGTGSSSSEMTIVCSSSGSAGSGEE